MEGLNFSKVPGSCTKCTIDLCFDYSELRGSISALLRALEYDNLDAFQRSYIGYIIESLLPSAEQFKMIQDLQLSGDSYDNKELAMQIECLKSENDRLIMNIDAVKETKEAFNDAIRSNYAIIEAKEQTIKELKEIIDTLRKPEKAPADREALEANAWE